jgi:predicted porin
MKKLLIASAALAMVAGTAQAQSSVTVYGIMDAGVTSVSDATTTSPAGTGRVTGVSTGGLATSRLGFRGTEDLGGGLKANFQLEAGLTVDNGNMGTVPTASGSTASTGTNTGGTIFDRQSWVGLESAKFGQIQIGRSTRLDFDTIVAGDAFGAAGFASAGQVTYGQVAALSPNEAYSANSRNRYTNAIKVATPRISGFQAAYQHSFGEAAGANEKSEGIAYALDYTQGKAKATYAYSRQNNATNGQKATETTALTGSYDFNVVKAFVGMSKLERTGNAVATDAQWVGVTAPVNAKVGLMAQYTKFDNLAGVSADDADMYALGATYALSKRTTGYAMYAKANNDGGAKLSVLGTMGITGAASAGVGQAGYTVGVRHSF